VTSTPTGCEETAMTETTTTTRHPRPTRRSRTWRRAAGLSGAVLAVAGIGVLVYDVAAATGSGSAPVLTTDGRPVAINARQGADGDRTFTAPVGDLCALGSYRSDADHHDTADGVRLDVDQTFTCADGSGTFTIRSTAFVHGCDAFHHGTWQFVAGTGAYRDVRGSGALVGLYTPGDACLGLAVDGHFRGLVAGA
jgi:hypothetical protein